MHIATASEAARTVTPGATHQSATPHATPQARHNASNGKQRQRHRRSCAWAFTTGLHAKATPLIIPRQWHTS